MKWPQIHRDSISWAPKHNYKLWINNSLMMIFQSNASAILSIVNNFLGSFYCEWPIIKVMPSNIDINWIFNICSPSSSNVGASCPWSSWSSFANSFPCQCWNSFESFLSIMCTWNKSHLNSLHKSLLFNKWTPCHPLKPLIILFIIFGQGFLNTYVKKNDTSL